MREHPSCMQETLGSVPGNKKIKIKIKAQNWQQLKHLSRGGWMNDWKQVCPGHAMQPWQ